MREGVYEHLSLGTDREKAGEHLLLYGSLLRRLWNRLYHGVAWHPCAWRSVSNWPRHAVLPAYGPLLLRLTLRARSWHLGRERDWSDPGQQGQNCAYESKMPANGKVADRFFVGVGGGWAASVGLPTRQGRVGGKPPAKGAPRGSSGKGGARMGAPAVPSSSLLRPSLSEVAHGAGVKGPARRTHLELCVQLVRRRISRRARRV